MIQEDVGDKPRNVPFKGVNQVNLMQGIHGQHIEKICAVVLGFETNVQGDLFTHSAKFIEHILCVHL